MPFCAFVAEGEGEGVGADFVDFVFLAEAGFAAAVEDVVVLACAVGGGAGEDAVECFCGGGY